MALALLPLLVGMPLAIPLPEVGRPARRYTSMPARNSEQIRQLEVPVIVRLGEKDMTMKEVLGMVPGAILELPRSADSELELVVNNKVIGCGIAVKIGENFGIRVTYLGDMANRVVEKAQMKEAAVSRVDADVAALADALMAAN